MKALVVAACGLRVEAPKLKNRSSRRAHKLSWEGHLYWLYLAVIECGMQYEDEDKFIRQKRRGAFNCKQLLYLGKYRPRM